MNEKKKPDRWVLFSSLFELVEWCVLSFEWNIKYIFFFSDSLHGLFGFKPFFISRS